MTIASGDTRNVCAERMNRTLFLTRHSFGLFFFFSFVFSMKWKERNKNKSQLLPHHLLLLLLLLLQLSLHNVYQPEFVTARDSVLWKCMVFVHRLASPLATTNFIQKNASNAIDPTSVPIVSCMARNPVGARYARYCEAQLYYWKCRTSQWVNVVVCDQFARTNSCYGFVFDVTMTNYEDGHYTIIRPLCQMWNFFFSRSLALSLRSLRHSFLSSSFLFIKSILDALHAFIFSRATNDEIPTNTHSMGMDSGLE